MTRHKDLDGFYRRAKREGYAARSVYKLEEMDRRWGLLRPGRRVLDLGCHPGSWLQYASRRVKKNGLVVGVDIQPLAVALPENARFVQADLMELEPERLRGFAPAYDLCLSDAAPRTTGVRDRDTAASLELARRVLELGLGLLKPGGSLVVKIYYAEGAQELIRRIKGAFRMGKAHRSKATTPGSRESYLVGVGLKAKQRG